VRGYELDQFAVESPAVSGRDRLAMEGEDHAIRVDDGVGVRGRGLAGHGAHPFGMALGDMPSADREIIRANALAVN